MPDVKYMKRELGTGQDEALFITRSTAETTGNIRAATISQTMTGAATANTVEALRVVLTSDVKTGAWANAIYGKIDYSTSGAAHGMAAAMCAEMVPPNSSLSRGALYALDLEFGCGASSTWASAGPVAFMKMENWGTAAHFSANAFLFHLAGETGASGALVSANTQTLKCRIGTTSRYLFLSQQENALHLGNYSTANTCDTAQNPWAASGSTIPLYVNATSTITDGNVYGAFIYLKQTADTTGSPRTLTLWNVVSHPTTTTCTGANALHANTYFDTGCTGVAGEAHAAASHLIFATETRTVQGTYCAHKFVNEFEANNTMPGLTTFFLRFHDAGAVKTPLMFDFNSCEAGASNCIVADTGAVDGIATTHYLRVIDPDGNLGYIAIFGAMS